MQRVVRYVATARPRDPAEASPGPPARCRVGARDPMTEQPVPSTIPHPPLAGEPEPPWLPDESWLAGRHALVVDDSASVREAITAALEQHGAEVAQAGDGARALEVATTRPLDLVVTDLEMPGIDGFELCRRLKESPATRSVPVVILSSVTSEPEVARCFEVGAAAYVSKQDAARDLRPTLAHVLRRATLLRDRTVLVVDDARSVRELVADGLRRGGFRASTAADGREALAAMEEATPDLVLCDLFMPVLDGLGLLRAVRARKDWRELPFLVMSTVTDRGAMRRLVQAGASGFLVKPFHMEQLVITVEKVLSDHFLLLLKERERLSAEQSAMLVGITALVAALEARDPYTRGHSDRVATIAGRIATELGLDAAASERVTLAGRLHDVGKIGVPDRVLLKPHELDAEESAIVRRHPAIGAQILSPIESLSDIVPAVLLHHERCDGAGYPEGRRANGIPLTARILAVADTFDALTSDRPYRAARPLQAALDVIRRARGPQLCPTCVDAFLEVASRGEVGCPDA